MKNKGEKFEEKDERMYKRRRRRKLIIRGNLNKNKGSRRK